MKLAIFPNNRFLCLTTLVAIFIASAQAYYSLLPAFEAFEINYRWKDFEAFVRLCLGVFWLALVAIFTIQEILSKAKEGEFEPRSLYGVQFWNRVFALPSLLIIWGIYSLGLQLGESNNLIELLTLSTKSIGLVIGGVALLMLLILIKRFLEKLTKSVHKKM